jgi:hypothetical protein
MLTSTTKYQEVRAGLIAVIGSSGFINVEWSGALLRIIAGCWYDNLLVSAIRY